MMSKLWRVRLADAGAVRGPVASAVRRGGPQSRRDCQRSGTPASAGSDASAFQAAPSPPSLSKRVAARSLTSEQHGDRTRHANLAFKPQANRRSRHPDRLGKVVLGAVAEAAHRRAQFVGRHRGEPLANLAQIASAPGRRCGSGSPARHRRRRSCRRRCVRCGRHSRSPRRHCRRGCPRPPPRFSPWAGSRSTYSAPR